MTMATKKMIPIKSFKPCPGCPTPAKCKKAGKPQKQAVAIALSVAEKAKAKKGKK